MRLSRRMLHAIDRRVTKLLDLIAAGSGDGRT